MANDLVPTRAKQSLHDSMAADLANLKALIAAEPDGPTKTRDIRDEAVAHRALQRIADRHAKTGSVVTLGIDKEP